MNQATKCRVPMGLFPRWSLTALATAATLTLTAVRSDAVVAITDVTETECQIMVSWTSGELPYDGFDVVSLDLSGKEGFESLGSFDVTIDSVPDFVNINASTFVLIASGLYTAEGAAGDFGDSNAGFSLAIAGMYTPGVPPPFDEDFTASPNGVPTGGTWAGTVTLTKLDCDPSHSVPESGSTLAALCAGLLGLVGYRRWVA